MNKKNPMTVARMMVDLRSAITSKRSSRSNSIPVCEASSGGLYSLVGGIMAMGYPIPPCYCSTAIAAAPRASWEKICV